MSGVHWPKPEEEIIHARKRVKEKADEISEFTRRAHFAKQNGQVQELDELKGKIFASLIDFDKIKRAKRLMKEEIRIGQNFEEKHDRDIARWTKKPETNAA